ncbi:hypothetical protein JHK86_048084 [Glycine max]|nr:hypothetical protein JHK86_048084 [Glycine max]
MYEEGVVITLKHRHYRINRPTELIARQILKKLGQYPITIRGLNYGHVKQMQGQVFHSIWADMVEEQIHWGYHNWKILRINHRLGGTNIAVLESQKENIDNKPDLYEHTKPKLINQ